jgi:type IV pilus assembly protein PilA
MREKRIGGDQGFTLIELLVVVVIIGVLVAIAIPVYLNYRKGAENKSAQSDVRGAISAIEQCYNDSGNIYPPGPYTSNNPAIAVSVPCGAIAGDAQKLVVSTGNTLVYTKMPLTLPVSYTVAVTNSDTKNMFKYDSFTGVTTKT